VNKVERLTDLAKRLAYATQQGTIAWTAESNTSFTYGRPSGSVKVTSERGDGEEPIELSLFDADGSILESLSSAWFDEYDQPAEWNYPLRELFEVARANALNIDSVVSDLLEGLPVPPPPDDLPF